MVLSSASDSHQDVQGVIGVLRKRSDGALSRRTACITDGGSPINDVIDFARNGTGLSSAMTSDTTITYLADYDSDNNGEGSLTFTGLDPNTFHYIVICTVSAENIRGDNNSVLSDDNALQILPRTSAAPAEPIAD